MAPACSDSGAGDALKCATARASGGRFKSVNGYASIGSQMLEKICSESTSGACTTEEACRSRSRSSATNPRAAARARVWNERRPTRVDLALPGAAVRDREKNGARAAEQDDQYRDEQGDPRLERQIHPNPYDISRDGTMEHRNQAEYSDPILFPAVLLSLRQSETRSMSSFCAARVRLPPASLSTHLM